MNPIQIQEAFEETAFFYKLQRWGLAHGMQAHMPWFFEHVLMDATIRNKQVVGCYAFEHLIGITVRKTNDYNSVDKIWQRLYQDMKRTEVFQDLLADEDECLGYEPNLSFPEATSIITGIFESVDLIYEENEDEEVIPGMFSAGFNQQPFEPARALGGSSIYAKHILRREFAQALFKSRPLYDAFATISYGDKFIYYSDYRTSFDVQLLTIDDVDDNIDVTTGRAFFMQSQW